MASQAQGPIPTRDADGSGALRQVEEDGWELPQALRRLANPLFLVLLMPF